jgi:hypothetical protein
VKPETQNRTLEPTGLAKPGDTRMLTGMGLGSARQESAGRVFARFCNRTDPFLRFKPGPLAGYPDPLLTLLPPKNKRQWSNNDFWHCIIANPEGLATTLTHNRTITGLSTQNMVVITSRLCPKHQHQRSVNDFWPCIMGNARAVWRH